MAKRKQGKINRLYRLLPEGLLVDAAWLSRHGYSTGLRSQYVTAGWLEQPARRVYQRPRGPLGWQQIVISLQTLLARDLVVGGRTALELHGFAHYLQQQTTTVYLHGPEKPPTWLQDLDVGVRFAYRNDGRLFRKQRISTAPHRLDADAGAHSARRDSIVTQAWGPWRWPLMISTPERAILELLEELPEKESFHQVDVLMEGLSTLSPARLQTLLVDCRSIKVKRLFFFFADRHRHAWLKRLGKAAIDLGSGKRMLVKGGRFDVQHLITVPETLDGVP
jgi:Transcriptional regulator, AbiEi antitoxin, Type IV TA system/Transcriptional regulator, AbiEi antitoxin N-terminal domain